MAAMASVRATDVLDLLSQHAHGAKLRSSEDRQAQRADVWLYLVDSSSLDRFRGRVRSAVGVVAADVFGSD